MKKYFYCNQGMIEIDGVDNCQTEGHQVGLRHPQLLGRAAGAAVQVGGSGGYLRQY